MIRVKTQGRVSPKFIPSSSLIKKAAQIVFQAERKKLKGDLQIIFTDLNGIKKLNKKFLDETGPTDVIAFPFQRLPGIPEDNFGDVFICVPVGVQNAKVFKEDPKRELIRLVIHGILHILGYDDHHPKEKKIMWDKQEEAVQKTCPPKK